jgi:hypothetical protein
MSWQSTVFAIEYIEQLRYASVRNCRRLSSDAWHNVMMCLPLHYVLDQLKAPMKNVDGGLFRILKSSTWTCSVTAS